MNTESGKAEEGIVGIFSRAAAKYDRVGPRVFSHFGERLVEWTHLGSGARVLDVAAGRGAVLFPAGKHVGPRGRVIGIDLSSDMVRQTTAEIHSAGLQNIEFHQMDAEQLQFPDASFDAVLCGFGLWFFPHPQRTLQEFLRVLKPGGCLGLSTWAEDSPLQVLYQQTVLRYLPPKPQTAIHPTPSKFDTMEQLEMALQQAGFEQLQVGTEDREFVYSREDEVWEYLWSIGMRRYLEQMAAPVLEQAKSDVYQQLQPLKQTDGIHGVFRALFARGIKPSP